MGGGRRRRGEGSPGSRTHDPRKPVFLVMCILV